MAAHWHAHVTIGAGPVDRSPAFSWERAKRFKDRCEARWSSPDVLVASRRGTLIVSGLRGRASVRLVPCADPRCAL